MNQKICDSWLESGVGVRAARPGPILSQPDRAEKSKPDPGPIGIGLARSSPI